MNRFVIEKNTFKFVSDVGEMRHVFRTDVVTLKWILYMDTLKIITAGNLFVHGNDLQFKPKSEVLPGPSGVVQNVL